MRKWQRYTQEFKDQAVGRLKGCTNVEALARELKVSRGILYLWRDKQEGRPPASKRPGPVVDSPAIAALKKEVVELKVALADKALEADFFKGALQRIEDRRRKQRKQWRSGIYGYIAEMMPSLQGKLSVERMCALAQVSRAGFLPVASEEGNLRSRRLQSVQPSRKIAAEHHRHYGYRRITAELRHRGMVVNRKRVLRMMQEDNLLAIRTRKFVRTTDSRHPFEVYLNLAKRMELTAPNQLWVADLTYIRLQQEFVYMAVVLDAFSRRVVGWALNRSLRSTVAVDALQQAIEQPKAAARSGPSF